MRSISGCFTLLFAYLFCFAGYADMSYNLFLESNDDQPSGSEVFLTEFDSFGDLLNGNFSGAFSFLNIGAGFSAGGLAFDGSQYHLLLESNDDRAAGSEVFMVGFNSYDDLLAGNANGTFSQLNIGSSFSAGGLAFDGSQYHLLLESNDDRTGGSEVFMASFGSYDDLIDSNFSGSFSQLNIGATFSAGGLAFDGQQYQLLLESDDDRPSGSEVFMASFDSFGDLLDGNIASGTFSQINIGTNFSSGGLVARASAIPEPSVLAFSPLLCVLLMRRARKQ